MGTAASKENSRRATAPIAMPASLFSVNKTLCEDGPPPPPPPPGSSQEAPPPPPPAEGGSDSIAEAAGSVSAYSNPGPYEQATMDVKRLLTLDTHDGFRCDINKQLSPYMAVVHSFWLGTNMIPDGRTKTYTWLTQVADAESLYMARCDPEKMSVDGRIHRAFFGGAGMAKLQLGLSPEGETDQCLLDVDLGAQTWTANVKYGSMGGGLVYGCNFFQAITPNLSMGGEGMYISANQNMISNYLVKYTIPAKGDDDLVTTKPVGPPGAPKPEHPSSTFYGQFNGAQQMLTLNYKRVVTPGRVTLGAELNCNPMTLESEVMLGAEFKFTRSKLQVTVDGNAKMQSQFETKLGKEPGQPTLSLSAQLDHLKDDMKFGYGLTIDG